MKATGKKSFPKSVIITGSNTGLGYQCAHSIASSKKDWHLIIACRDSGKGNEAVSRLITDTNNRNISSMELDLASLSSIRNFATVFSNAHLPSLHAIVCNAGLLIIKGTAYTHDGFEMTFGVNHLGHFLLVNLLLKYMSATGRIVFVSSGTHDPEQTTGMPAPVYVDAQTLAYPDNSSAKENDAYIGRRRYSTSKLCNIYCAYELADRIGKETGTGITVNAFDPGLMPGTGLARQVNPMAFLVWKYVMPVLTWLPINANTPEKSGSALASLVTNPEFSNITGRYFEGTKERKSSKLSDEKENALDLWNTSLSLVGLRREETILSL